MTNLLDNPVPEGDLARLICSCEEAPVLPRIDSPAWQIARAKPPVERWFKELIVLAQKECQPRLPPLTDTLYQTFYKTGDNLRFESVYFDRRRILARAAMAVLMGDAADRRQFTPSLLGKVEQTMAEDSWTFPTHIWENASGKDPMMIDLFAAETANLMGELLTVFGPLIPGDLAHQMRSRLRKNVFENFLAHPFHWEQATHNWNAVCHQGVIGSALAVEQDATIVAAMLVRGATNLRHFLAGFGQDGSTSEGPGYWSYGFGRFAELNAQLEARTRGALSLFADNPLVPKIAAFGPALALANNHLVNFSDGAGNGALNPSLVAYLGCRLNLPALAVQSRAGYSNLSQNSLNFHQQRCDFFHLTRLFLRCPDSLDAADPPLTDSYFPNYGTVVSHSRDDRGNLWEFAAKAGNNDEHHNHNDCGSFLLNLNGHPALIEIGPPQYVRGYFGTDQRYTFLAARSLGHSVPFVNGWEQAAGSQYSAIVLACEIQADSVHFVMDLARCYPQESGCRKLVRTFRLNKRAGTLLIADDFELNATGTVESILICQAPVQATADEAKISAPGGVALITTRNGTHVGLVERCDHRGHFGTQEHIHRIRLIPASPARAGTIACQIHL